MSFTLYDFMEYPNLALGFGAMRPLAWQKHDTQQRTRYDRLISIWFGFGAFNLIYQNIGLVIYLLLPKSEAEKQLEPISLVAQISETGSIMGLTIVGACKLWMLLYHRKTISNLLNEFNVMLPHKQSLAKLYRLEHYYHKSSLLMRRTTFFFMFAYTYYNVLPIIEFLYEYYSKAHEFQYKYQSNTWYPWQLYSNKRSLLSFVAAYICQAQSSLSGVAFIMGGEFLLCFFITQMQLHFDYLARAFGKLDARHAQANVQLKELIGYHIRLLRISKVINRIFNVTFVVNFAISTIAICLMGFSMVMISLAYAFKYSVGLMAFLVFTLFICYNGSEFTTASDKLMPAAFYNNWYDGDATYRKMIFIFIMRSCESSTLRAYKFTTVSMQTYMAILKLSYQLYTFFRAMV